MENGKQSDVPDGGTSDRLQQAQSSDDVDSPSLDTPNTQADAAEDAAGGTADQDKTAEQDASVATEKGDGAAAAQAKAATAKNEDNRVTKEEKHDSKFKGEDKVRTSGPSTHLPGSGNPSSQPGKSTEPPTGDPQAQEKASGLLLPSPTAGATNPGAVSIGGSPAPASGENLDSESLAGPQLIVDDGNGADASNAQNHSSGSNSNQQPPVLPDSTVQDIEAADPEAPNVIGSSEPALDAELAPAQADIDSAVQRHMQQMENDYQQRIQQELQQRLVPTDAVAVEPVPHLNGLPDSDAVNASDSKRNKPESQPQHRQRRRILALVLCTFIIAAGILAIVLAVSSSNDKQDTDSSLVGSDNEESQDRNIPDSSVTQAPAGSQAPTASPAPTDEPSMPPTQYPSSAPSYFINQTDLFYDIIDIILPSISEFPAFTDMSHFENPNTIPYQVVDWMANNDAGTLSIFETYPNRNETFPVTQRYNDTADWPYLVLQRYLLATIYVKTGGPNWVERYNFMTDENTCAWNDPVGLLGANCDFQHVVTTLWLLYNNLTGTIPEELYHLSFLDSLELRGMGIEGTISSAVAKMDKLSEWFTSDCLITGTVPTEISLMASMTSLGMYNSLLEGTIPTETGLMHQLTLLVFLENDMTGTIPSQIEELSLLEILDIASNDFVGTVPPGIAQLTLLEVFMIYGTQLTGNLDPLFCAPELADQRAPLSFFHADCLGSLDGELPPRVACSCCRICCTRGTECYRMLGYVSECGVGCVFCTFQEQAPTCSECIDAGSNGTDFSSECHRSCQMDGEECVPRFEFDK